MTSNELLVLLFCSFLSASALGGCALTWKRRGAGRPVFLFTSLTGLTAVTASTLVWTDGVTAFGLVRDAASQPNPRLLLSATCGILLGISWFPLSMGLRLFPHRSFLRRFLDTAMCALPLILLTAFALLAYDQQFDIQLTQVTCADRRFVIDKLTVLDETPIRIATDNSEDLYVTFYNADNYGRHSGGVLKLHIDGAVDRVTTRVVAQSDALYRPYGLAVYSGDLYVSRSGHIVRTAQGSRNPLEGGAITLLRDLDGDGYFEYYDDVINNLPGARGPDTMHQNNGIAFDQQGDLYVAVGTNDDAVPDHHPLGGTVLKVEHATPSATVLARGFRNPFGITVGPNGAIFVTDNDSATDVGDEVNHVIEGEHYGHPFMEPDSKEILSRGFRNPILLSDKHSNYTGIAYTESQNLPPEYRRCLYVADRLGNSVLRLTLRETDDTYQVTDVTPFIHVHSPIDIAFAPTGELFVASLLYRTVYRVRLQQPPTSVPDF